MGGSFRGGASVFRGGTSGGATLNYRHHFHAGNFADLIKHAILLALLERMTAEPGPLLVLDTHAGAGVYDLQGAEAQKSREAEAGIGRLMADAQAPAAFASLKAAVDGLNGGEPLRLYPGSPALVLPSLRPGDRFLACELRADDYAACAALMSEKKPAGAKCEALRTDGFAMVAKAALRPEPRALVLVDPPYERNDDYKRALTSAKSLIQGKAGAVLAIWTPLKDLDTFDRFLSGLESLHPRAGYVAQVRLRPLTDPMNMNGCAVAVVGEAGSASEAKAAADWIVARVGDPGGEARVTALRG